jgi:chromosome segregation ATPase
MNAMLLDRPDFSARYTVSLGNGGQMEVQFAELRSDVRHIQSDVYDIKATVRETNQGLVGLREKLEQNNADLSKRIDATAATHNDKLDGTRRELSEKFEGTRTEMVSKMDAMALRMDNERKELTMQTVAVRDELTGRFDRLAAGMDSGREELYRKLSGDIYNQGTRLDGRIDELARKVDVNHKEVTHKIEDVKNDVWKTRIWMLAVQIGVELRLAGTLLGVMAHGFHWL